MQFAIVLVLTPIQVLVYGAVLKDLWLWFIVPFGVVEIGLAHALGLSTLISLPYAGAFAMLPQKDDDAPQPNGILARFAVCALAAVLAWCFGWVYQNFM